MRIFGPETKFSQFMGASIDVILLSLLWCLFSITIVGIGPASTALYYAMAKAVRHDRGGAIKEFFSGLKDGWKNSILIGIFIMLLGVGILMLDGYALVAATVENRIEEPVRFVFGLVEIFFFLGISIYAFPLVSRFEMRFWNVLILSIMLMFRHFWRTLCMVALLLAALLFVIGLPEFFILVPGIYTVILTGPMERILKKYLEASGFQPTDDMDVWYLE